MPILCPGCMSELAPEATQCGVCLRARSRQEVFRGIRELKAEEERRRKRPFMIAGAVLATAAAAWGVFTGKVKLPKAAPPAAVQPPPAQSAVIEAAAPVPAQQAPYVPPEEPKAYSLSRPGTKAKGPAAAQELWSIQGRVYDLLSLKPVAGASVVLSSTATGKKRTVKTGKDGRYKVKLPALQEGGYAVDVAHPAYRPGYLDEAEPPYSDQSESRRIEAGRLLRESVIMHVPVTPQEGETDVHYDVVLSPLPR